MSNVIKDPYFSKYKDPASYASMVIFGLFHLDKDIFLLNKHDIFLKISDIHSAEKLIIRMLDDKYKGAIKTFYKDINLWTSKNTHRINKPENRNLIYSIYLSNLNEVFKRTQGGYHPNTPNTIRSFFNVADNYKVSFIPGGQLIPDALGIDLYLKFLLDNKQGTYTLVSTKRRMGIMQFEVTLKHYKNEEDLKLIVKNEKRKFYPINISVKEYDFFVNNYKLGHSNNWRVTVD